MEDESCAGSNDLCFCVRGGKLDPPVKDLAEGIGFEFQAGDPEAYAPSTAKPELGIGTYQFMKLRMNCTSNQHATSVACKAHSQHVPDVESSMKDWGSAIESVAFG